LEGLVEQEDPTQAGDHQPLYGIPSTRVDFHLLKIGVPTSVLRTTGYGPNIFALECFMDELAHRANQDPYRYRRNLIGNQRLLNVLDLVAEKSGWSRKKPGLFRGIACTEAFKTHIAHVVELSVTGKRIKIHRIICAIDAGTVLDPGITKNSLEGGTVWGLGAAFTSNISFAEGQSVEENFNGFQITRMNEVPPVEVHILNSGARPLGGTGEVGPVTLVPAVANAIFSATGQRYRSLPLSRHGFSIA
jgi:isoquinoline 1-oxidoreductase beta subunit